MYVHIYKYLFIYVHMYMYIHTYTYKYAHAWNIHVVLHTTFCLLHAAKSLLRS